MGKINKKRGKSQKSNFQFIRPPGWFFRDSSSSDGETEEVENNRVQKDDVKSEDLESKVKIRIIHK